MEIHIQPICFSVHIKMNFTDFNIDEKIIRALKLGGITQPTDVQEESIPMIEVGKSIIVQSNTGTGKTFAFLIPLIDRLLRGDERKILILAPTRELVIQISDSASEILGNLKKVEKTDSSGTYLSDTVSVIPVYGGKDIKSQINRLKNGTGIIVATPGRLLDHIDRKTIDLSDVKTVVIDEVDQMLLMGFRNEVDYVLNVCKKCRQFIFLSATVDSAVKKIAYRYAKNLSIVTVDVDRKIPDTIEQKFIHTTDRKKFDDFVSEIKKDNPFMAIVFCRTKARVDNLELKLGQAGFNCAKIHSDISQNKRERILRDFRDMKIQFLISTDLASRGLDINGVTNIYNYDFPEKTEDYIHRIGRTGRLDKNGKSTTFVTDKNTNFNEFIKEIENL